MSKIIITACVLSLAGVLATSSAAGFGGPSDYYRGHETASGNGKQLPVILMHKQALQQDGGFQYAFAADNGLRQGETIRPDGSRTGAYSYTDPEGKEITVKYTAGKDGFRIVQGDHVPKAPPSAVQPYSAPSPSLGRGGSGGGAAKNRLFGAPGGPGSQFNRGNAGRFDYDSGEAFGPPPPPSSFKSPRFPKQSALPAHYRVREDNSAELSARYEDDGPSAYDGAGDYSSHRPFRAPGAAADNNSQHDDDDNDDRRPHSFGNGYAFEFAGTDAGASSAEF